MGNITVDAALAQSKQKEQVRRLCQQVGFVFQNFNLFPHRSVTENIIEGPVIVKGEAKEDVAIRAVCQVVSSRVWPLPAHWRCDRK